MTTDRLAKDYGRVTPSINSSVLLKETRKKLQAVSQNRNRNINL